MCFFSDRRGKWCKIKNMSKCYKDVHVPAPQEINSSKLDKRKVKAFESFVKSSYMEKIYFFQILI